MSKVKFKMTSAMINPKYNLDPFRAGLFVTGVNKFFNRRWFSISDLEELIEILGVEPDRVLIKELHILHCVDWAEMEPEFAQEVRMKVINQLDINIDVIDLEFRELPERRASTSTNLMPVSDKNETPVKKSMLANLLRYLP